MFLIILGILDMIAGAMLTAGGFFSLAANSWIFWFSVIYILKGLYSILAAAANNFYFDLFGILDLFVGVFLLLSFYGMSTGFFMYVGIIMLLKAAYTIMMGVVSK